MKRKLCIDLRWIDCSGIGTYIKGLMPGLSAVLSDVDIVGLGSMERLSGFSWAHARNFSVVDCRAGRYSMAEQFVLPLAIPRDTDLFFSPHYPIPLLYRGRFAVTVHDLSHVVVPEIADNLVKRAYAKTMLRNVRLRASLILTVSNFSKKELLRCTRGSRADNIVTVYEGVSDEWYDAAQSDRPHDRPYLVYVGNIKPYKNVSRLVEAFLSVMGAVPHDLVIVGQHDGLITGESEGFFARARSAGNRIQFTGQVSQDQLLAFVGNADALVMPSLYEGFGFPPLEAMAAGVPTLVSRAASLPEVCGDATLYCDPLSVEGIGAGIVSILTDEALRRRLICAGKEQARKYSWGLCAQQTASAIRTIL
jgi:glycosyltransferase involved in cell wall biosynthesis